MPKPRRRGGGSTKGNRRLASAPQTKTEGGSGTPPSSPEMTIVAIGASAGGLDAFTQLLHALPSDPGIAIVLVQHLAPQHDSALAALLSMQTLLPVVQASDGVRVERNHVYVIPPNVQAGMRDDWTISLVPRPTDRSQYTPIDAFMRSLAEVAQEHAIAVILSGTASDGTQGVRDINALGGFTFAQRPETAKYDGMPRAAIATGLIDLIGSPAEIAIELVRLSRTPRVRADHELVEGPGRSRLLETQYETVLSLLRVATGVDFMRYKPA